MSSSYTLTIVVPCYNEEAVLHETTRQLLDVSNKMSDVSTQILYVDDGSHDITWNIICDLSKQHPCIHGIKLAHNAGHQRALWAGLEWAAQRSDAAISIDADLQDDVQVIPEMVECHRNGADIVFGVRRERKTDTFFKRATALMLSLLMVFSVCSTSLVIYAEDAQQQAALENQNGGTSNSGEKMSRSEQNKANRNAINDARRRMAEKYGDIYDESYSDDEE